MPRPYSPIRIHRFDGLVDGLNLEPGETQAATLQNLYRIRDKLVRRKGTNPLGTADLSPDQDLNGLFWDKIHDHEILLSVDANGNIGDWYMPVPGQTLLGGAGVLSGGTHDADDAWVNQQVFIGDGYGQNQFVSDYSGLAVNFVSASSQKLSIANNASLQLTGGSFTGALDVYFNTVTGTGVLLSKSAGGVNTTEYEVGLDNSSHLNFTVGNAGGLGPSSIAWGGGAPIVLSTGQWYHFVFWFDASAGANGTIYIQGNNGTVYSGALSDPIIAPSTNAFALGSRSDNSHYLNARMDNVRVWKGRVLSAAERTALWNGGVPLMAWQLPGAGLTTSLVGAWDMEETSGTRGDLSGTGNNLAQTNTPGTAAGIGDTQLKVQQAMVGPPSAACTAAADGVGSGNGTYTFVYCYLAASGELSEPSPASNSVNLVGQKADLTGVTVSSEPGVTARYIFATGGTRTDYVLVDILANNTATTVTVNLDGIINPFSPLIFGNTRFPPCRYLVSHQSRMVGAWCATSEGDKQTLYISNYLAPWYAPASPDLTISANGTRAQLQGPAAGEITGLCPHGDYCAVFTGGSGFFLIGTEAADFRVQLFSNHGCVAHRTIQSVRHLLIWLAPDGIYAYNGIAVERISEDVRETILAMSADDMAKAHSFVFYDRYYLCWPGKCLWYDLLHRIWGENTNWDWRCSTVSTYTSSTQQRIYAGQRTKARAWQLESGSSDNGAAIPAAWASKSWDMGLPVHEKRIHLIEARFKKGTGTAVLTLYRGTGELIQTIDYDLSAVNNPSDQISVLVDSAVEQARDEFFQMQVACSTTDVDFEVLGCGLQWVLVK